MDQDLKINHEVPFEYAGQRLDQVVAALCPDFSRSQLQKWIKAGSVLVDGAVLKPKERLEGGELLEIQATYSVQTPFEPEAIKLNIVYEDDDILVINKPAGLVVHPAAGNWSGTLVNGLLSHCPELEQLPRAGIVHRLDKETTGLMVVAKSLTAHNDLVRQLQERTVKREYLALVFRSIIAGATIEGNIGRHHVDRKRMAVVTGGKPAITHYRVEERFKHHTLLRVSLETGRTHQIRVHMSWQKMPIVGDPVYGGRHRVPAGISEEFREQLTQFPRQALHATQLGLDHPKTGEYMQWQAEMPEDMQTLVAQIRKEAASES